MKVALRVKLWRQTSFQSGKCYCVSNIKNFHMCYSSITITNVIPSELKGRGLLLHQNDIQQLNAQYQ